MQAKVKENSNKKHGNKIFSLMLGTKTVKICESVIYDIVLRDLKISKLPVLMGSYGGWRGDWSLEIIVALVAAVVVVVVVVVVVFVVYIVEIVVAGI